MISVLDEMRAVLEGDEDFLMHYGTKFHSGRYPYGSGEDPFQHDGDFLTRVERLKKEEGFKETAEEVQRYFGMKLEDYRNEKYWADYTRKEQQVAKAKSLKEKGLGNSAIGKELGVNESTVRSWLNPNTEARMQAAKQTADFLKEQVAAKNWVDVGKDAERYIYVGEDAEKKLGITRTRLDQALYALEAEGYKVYQNRVEQPTNRGNYTTQMVLCPPGTEHKDVINHPEKVRTIEDYQYQEGIDSFKKKFTYPASLDSSRLKIRYADEKGPDGITGIEKDGLIELRRGVADLDLQGDKYSQVRILVDGTHYLKGMAVYSDDMPDGVDVIFNTNKTSNVPAIGKTKDDKSVLKAIKDDPENPFGSLIKDADKGGQYWYTDSKTGEKKLGLINKKSAEGDWSEWTDALPSQFLSKQSTALAKRQLNLASNDRYEEFNRICEINNPTIKKHLLQSFADDCDGAAVNLKAAALPGQKYHAIIPINTLKDTEIYAPDYKDGTKLALVRYPHAGIFEIPVLTVNNKNKLAQKVLGKDINDAVGITKAVADQLSGADFDGDTVMCIPTDYGKIHIDRKPYLKELKGFDDKIEYGTEHRADGYYNNRGEKVKIMTPRDTQMQMGIISNLITDMTLSGGASDEEMARAVKHSMVVIDAEKHKLDYKRSEVENNIQALKEKYQRTLNPDGTIKTGGASTIVSRAKSVTKVDKRRGQGVIDPETGEKTYRLAKADDLYYVDRKYDKATGIVTLRTDSGKRIEYDSKDPEATAKYSPVRKFNDDGTVSYTNKAGDISYKVKTRTQDSTKMAEAKDANELVSAARHPMELIYADYANSMKSLANQARKEMLSTGNLKHDPSATKVYKQEVDSLMARLNEAEKNSVRERQAIRLANAEVKAKQKAKEEAGSEMSKSEVRKASQRAMSKYRQEVGSVSRRDRNIKITDREWEAIQAGAISENKLKRILANADVDELRQRATPRDSRAISVGQENRIKALSASGNYTIAEIADQLGLSSTTVKKYLKGVD